MREHNPFFLIAILAVFAVGVSVINFGQDVIYEIEDYDAAISKHASLDDAPLRPIYAKGLYLTASSAAQAKKRAEIIRLIGSTELNAVVIDIKDFSGYILYDSSLPLANALHTDRDVLKNIRSVIRDFKKAHIYVIARQTVFQDPALVTAKPEWAIRRSDGSVWRDYKGLAWVDPTKKEVWDYNIAIAKEAARLGFNEINFDYVRFPSDGNIRQAVYSNLEENKTKTMTGFYSYLSKQLSDANVFTSLDMFGLVLESGSFDLNIGQTLAAAKDTVHYIYPMTYPSHYADGHLGYANPAQYPYEIVSNGLRMARSEMLGSTTRLRPWLQAFDLGAVYDARKIRAQITAAEESDLTDGWFLWNASNRYTDAGLKAKNAL